MFGISISERQAGRINLCLHTSMFLSKCGQMEHWVSRGVVDTIAREISRGVRPSQPALQTIEIHRSTRHHRPN